MQAESITFRVIDFTEVFQAGAGSRFDPTADGQSPATLGFPYKIDWTGVDQRDGEIDFKVFEYLTVDNGDGTTTIDKDKIDVVHSREQFNIDFTINNQSSANSDINDTSTIVFNSFEWRDDETASPVVPYGPKVSVDALAIIIYRNTAFDQNTNFQQTDFANSRFTESSLDKHVRLLQELRDHQFSALIEADHETDTSQLEISEIQEDIRHLRRDIGEKEMDEPTAFEQIETDRENYEAHLDQFHQVATQDQAEDPTDQSTLQFTPERIHQAIESARVEGTVDEIEAGTDTEIKEYSPETLNQAVDALRVEGTVEEIETGTEEEKRSYSPQTLKTAIDNIVGEGGDEDSVTEEDFSSLVRAAAPRSVNPAATQVARVDFGDKIYGIARVDGTDFSRATDAMGDPIAKPLQIEMQNVKIGGIYKLIILKAADAADPVRIRYPSATVADVTFGGVGSENFPLLSQQDGALEVIVRVNDLVSAGGAADDVVGIATSLTAGGGGGGGAAANLGVLINGLVETPTISPEDKIPLAHGEVTQPKIHYSGSASLSNPLGLGYNIVASDYAGTVTLGGHVYHYIPGYRSDTFLGETIDLNAHATAGTALRGLQVKEARGPEKTSGLLIRSDGERVIFIVDGDELSMELKIATSSISEVSLPATYMATPFGPPALEITNIGAAATTVGGYVWNLNSTQAGLLWDLTGASPVSREEIHIVPLNSVVGGRSQPRLNIQIGSVWYEGGRTTATSALYFSGENLNHQTVSYTHLTLPTIYSV